MELIFVKRENPEWNYIWDLVAKHPINEGIEEPQTAFYMGESWQYMGSFKNGDRVIHEFRHRYHPRTQSRQYIKFNASENFTNDQIDKSTTIK